MSACAISALALAPAMASSDINAGSIYLASNLGSSVNATFNGGTLELDSTTTISRGFSVKDVSTNTIDIDGHTVTMSGAFTGSGPLTITDSVGGGLLTFTSSSNTYSGTTTIASGATLALSGTGTIADSAKLVSNGTFDISATDSGASIISLSGSGSVVLGSEALTLSDAAGDTFSGAISGTGSISMTEGTETFTGTNTYTGTTTITAGTLYLSGGGSIASSSSVIDYGTLDISGTTSGASLQSLAGYGYVALGTQNLTLTSAIGTFTGIISGTGNLVLNAGTEYLTGANTLGGIVINGGTLELGSSSVAYNITTNSGGTLAFYSSGTIAMSGTISGTGGVSNIGSGITTISAAETYTGATTISSGTMRLAGSGSIASSSGVTVNGFFDISSTNSGTSITSLAGAGTVTLGTQTLTLTNASTTFSGTISGAGGVTLNGGTQTFSGTNTYTGTTTISGGTLVLKAGATLASAVVDNATLDISTGTATTGSATLGSLSGSGAVMLGGNVLVLSNAGDTFSGVISGTGGLWIGGGTETLSGANTYTGTTTVSAGKLIVTSTGGLSSAGKLAINGTLDMTAVSGTSLSFVSLSGVGTVSLGAHSLELTNASGSFSGVISGSGGLLISSGTEILSGNNTYTGGTTVASGATLQIGQGSSAGSVVGDIADNGTLAFGGSATGTFSGVISGTGALTRSGTGTTILTADNTYSGGTTISSGTLQIGNGGTSGSIVGNVVDDGVLAFDRSDTVTIGATISGTGGLEQMSGTTVLTSANGYTGRTIVDSGATLALSGTGSIASSMDVRANGTFDVSAASSAPGIVSLSGSGTVNLGAQTLTLSDGAGTFSGAVTGTGGLVLTAGTETLSGTNTYTGLTTINGGMLAVTGSVTPSQGVIVNSGGSLSGTGTVSALTVNTGGTVSGGAAGSGTLTVAGSASFASGSTYAVTTSSTTTTSLTATGTASLAGTLSVTSSDGTYALGQKLTVLTADSGLTGTFSLGSVASTGAELKSALTYDANHVYLEIDLAKLSPLLPTAASRNQAQVVSGIDTAIAAGDSMPLSFEALGNDTSPGLASDATQLSGELGSDLPQVGNVLFGSFLDAMFDHIADGQPAGAAKVLPRRVDTWLTGMAGTSITGGDAATGSHRLKTSVTGVVGGANWTVTPNIMLGGALSAAFTHFLVADDLGGGDANALQAGVYGYIQYSPHFYGSFAAGFARADITTHRSLTVSGATDDLKGKLTATIYGGRYETGVLMNWATLYAAVQEQMTSLPAYTETASSGTSTFALHYDSRSVNATRVELGLRDSIDRSFRPFWVLTPNGTFHLTGKLAWAHDFGSGADVHAAFADLSSSDFAVIGAKAAKDSALVAFGADLEFDGGLRLTTRVDTAVSANTQTYTGYAGIGYRW